MGLAWSDFGDYGGVGVGWEGGYLVGVDFHPPKLPVACPNGTPHNTCRAQLAGYISPQSDQASATSAAQAKLLLPQDCFQI